MKIVIQAKNLKLNQALEDYINEKLNSLEKFVKVLYNEKYYDHFFSKGKPRVEAWVEIGKITLHHKKGPFFWAECQMRFPKRTLRSIAKSDNIKQAITEVKDELQRQLKQYQEKFQAKTKREARIFKKELKLSPSARFYRKGRIREEGI